jgi:ribosomal protein S18 acetylase RimI-like enzyme
MDIEYRILNEADYDELFALWNEVPQTKRALNPVDDTREGITSYMNRNPHTCFGAFVDGKLVGAILSGHDGRRGIIHHLCVNPTFQKKGIARTLVRKAEDALKGEGIQKIFCLVFVDNDPANAFWEKMGYPARTNLNYRNKSLNASIPTGE